MTLSGELVPNRIFVGNLPLNVTDTELFEYFGKLTSCQVKEVKIITDPKGSSKGYGFVTFDNENEANSVLNLSADLLVFKDFKLNLSNAYKRTKHYINYNNIYINNGSNSASMTTNTNFNNIESEQLYLSPVTPTPPIDTNNEKNETTIITTEQIIVSTDNSSTSSQTPSQDNMQSTDDLNKNENTTYDNNNNNTITTVPVKATSSNINNNNTNSNKMSRNYSNESKMNEYVDSPISAYPLSHHQPNHQTYNRKEQRNFNNNYRSLHNQANQLTVQTPNLSHLNNNQQYLSSVQQQYYNSPGQQMKTKTSSHLITNNSEHQQQQNGNFYYTQSQQQSQQQQQQQQTNGLKSQSSTSSSSTAPFSSSSSSASSSSSSSSSSTTSNQLVTSSSLSSSSSSLNPGGTFTNNNYTEANGGSSLARNNQILLHKQHQVQSIVNQATFIQNQPPYAIYPNYFYLNPNLKPGEYPLNNSNITLPIRPAYLPNQQGQVTPISSYQYPNPTASGQFVHNPTVYYAPHLPNVLMQHNNNNNETNSQHNNSTITNAFDTVNNTEPINNNGNQVNQQSIENLDEMMKKNLNLQQQQPNDFNNTFNQHNQQNHNHYPYSSHQAYFILPNQNSTVNHSVGNNYSTVAIPTPTPINNNTNGNIVMQNQQQPPLPPPPHHHHHHMTAPAQYFYYYAPNSVQPPITPHQAVNPQINSSSNNNANSQLQSNSNVGFVPISQNAQQLHSYPIQINTIPTNSGLPGQHSNSINQAPHFLPPQPQQQLNYPSQVYPVSNSNNNTYQHQSHLQQPQQQQQTPLHNQVPLLQLPTMAYSQLQQTVNQSPRQHMIPTIPGQYSQQKHPINNALNTNTTPITANLPKNSHLLNNQQVKLNSARNYNNKSSSTSNNYNNNNNNNALPNKNNYNNRTNNINNNINKPQYYKNNIVKTQSYSAGTSVNTRVQSSQAINEAISNKGSESANEIDSK